MHELFILAAIAFVAAAVNGALGYGFSSITVPLALLLVSNRLLNPAIVAVEVALNAYVLWVNRRALARTWRRVLPIIVGLTPGVAVGTMALARTNPDWLRLATFALLLPFILLQAAGFRRPLRAERAVGGVFGAGVGALYAISTVSGPPLAIFLNNQGFAKQEFRAALGLIRVAEAIFTSTAYANARLLTAQSTLLALVFVPSVLLGVPLGAWLIRRVPAETFRRVCMTFDGAVVALGLSRLLRDLRVIDGPSAYLILLGVVAFDAVLLYRYFRVASSNSVVCSPAVAP
jgi:uncharacterized membrane protein YfcA